MRKRNSKEKKTDPAAGLPTNPEFQKFGEFLGELVKVPKTEVDKLVAEEAEERKRKRA